MQTLRQLKLAGSIAWAVLLLYLLYPAMVRAVWRQSRSLLNRLPNTPRRLIYRQELRLFLFVFAQEFQGQLSREQYLRLSEGFPVF